MAKFIETVTLVLLKIITLDDINESELKNLEKRDDGKFEVII